MLACPRPSQPLPNIPHLTFRSEFPCHHPAQGSPLPSGKNSGDLGAKVRPLPTTGVCLLLNCIHLAENLGTSHLSPTHHKKRELEPCSLHHHHHGPEQSHTASKKGKLGITLVLGPLPRPKARPTTPGFAAQSRHSNSSSSLHESRAVSPNNNRDRYPKPYQQPPSQRLRPWVALTSLTQRG